MKETISELNKVVNEFVEKISQFPESEMAEKPLPHKWSKKEVVGHLVDSGQNNLRRFIVSQYSDAPPKIVYEQDFWVKAHNYQEMNSKDVIELWRLVNLQIAHVLSSMSPENYNNMADTGRVEVNLHSLEWLANDYVLHMKHHLNQVIKGSFDLVYP